MASIKVKFHPSSVADREGSVYYQIIHERKVRQLPTAYKVYPSEWDEARSMVAVGSADERRQLVISVRDRIRSDLERLVRIDRKLGEGGIAYTADDLIGEYNRYLNEYSLLLLSAKR